MNMQGQDTTDTTTTPIRPTRAKQTQIPGTERKVIKAVEEAAIEYRNARDERMELTKDEVAKRAALIAVMQKHEVTVYKFDDDVNEEVTVELSEKTKVKVRKSSSAPDSEDA